MNKEELIEEIGKVCLENPKKVGYSIVRKLRDVAQQYADSQTSELKSEIERLKRNEEAYKNRIRVLEKFIPKSENNVTLD